MAEQEDDDDRIPLLEDVVRVGREAAIERSAQGETLSEAEIEAIAARVVERHTKEMEQAVARAIRTALEHKQRSDREPGTSGES